MPGTASWSTGSSTWSTARSRSTPVRGRPVTRLDRTSGQANTFPWSSTASSAPRSRSTTSCPDGCLRTDALETPMKLIIAVIQPTKLEAVKEALSKVEVFRLTVMDVQGFGREKGASEVYRGHEVTVNVLRKI